MKISIITVTYNRGSVIKDTIESVLRQEFKDYEYIIVDGASTDNTKEILQEYEYKFEGRMRWISEPDKGLYDAINKGLKMATGDVVGIINSDDFFHRYDIFNIIDSAFKGKDVDAIYGDEIDMDASNPSKKQIYSGAFFKNWMFRIGMMPAHQTFYARKELFEKYGYYKTDYKIAADFELMLRFFYINKVKAKYVGVALLTFRTGGISTQWKNKMLLNRETLRACRENNLFCILPMVWLKYFLKIKQLFVQLS